MSVLYGQEKEVFLQKMEFRLENVSNNTYENEYFVTIKLNKGTNYKFKITNNMENLPGKAEIQLLDGNDPVLMNIMGEKYFESVNFNCNKTAFYDVLIRYQEEKPGYSIIDLYMLQ